MSWTSQVKLIESPGMWKAGIALLWDVWDLGARAREVERMDVQCVQPDRSNQCVFCNILGEKIQMNENYSFSSSANSR